MVNLIKTAYFILIATSIATVGGMQITSASAANNFQCSAPFNKKVLSSNSVRCQKKSSNFSSRGDARDAANGWLSSASCNGHQSIPKKKVWKNSNGKWAARVKFICTHIT